MEMEKQTKPIKQKKPIVVMSENIRLTEPTLQQE